MSVKYHISPKTGKPNQCKATVSECPWASESEHYPTREDAQRAYEESMKRSTLPTVSKKTPNASVEESKPSFSKAFKELPAYKYNASEKKLLADLDKGLIPSAEKLDAFLDTHRNSVVRDAFNNDEEVANSREVLNYVKAVRETYGTPSTLNTLDSFDPSRQTVFSNPRARTSAKILGTAVRREVAHSDWMRELAQQHRQTAEMIRHDDTGSWGSAPEDYEESARIAEDEAIRSDARVLAQLKEFEYLYKTDPIFAKTVTPSLKNLMESTGIPNLETSRTRGLPIGKLKKIKQRV